MDVEQSPYRLAHPVARFDALLRDILSFAIAYRGSDGKWALHPDAEQRLTELAAARRPHVTPLIRFGLGCDACHANGPTRLRSGRYLCESCLFADGFPQVSGLLSQPNLG